MVPGLDLVRTGSFGGTTAVFMRGAKSEHTLVLIDGIQMNDPSSTGGGYNFSNLTTDNIEQAIERAGTKAGNKGVDAAMTAIEMVNLLKQL